MRFVALFSRLLLFGGLASLSLSAQPVWWSSRGAVVGQADDYTAATLGQLKTISVAAAFEMNLRLPGGAGTDIDNLIAPWWQPAGVGVVRDDYAAVNQGQLKTVAKLFYDRLGLVYPWTSGISDDDDYALANLGQLKYVFSFPILAPGITDTDADGLADSWETTHFGNLAATPAANADTDALSNRAESLIGGTGSDPESAADESSPAAIAALGLVVYSP